MLPSGSLMSSRKEQGIADDASEYEEIPEPNESVPSARGIASDAELFEDLVAETTGEARSLNSKWLYQVDGQVFGPVKPRELLQMLYDGELTLRHRWPWKRKNSRPSDGTGSFAPICPK